MSEQKPENLHQKLEIAHQKPEIVDHQWVTHSRLFHVEQLDLRFSNGAERQYERLNPGTHRAVMIVPMLDAETVLLVKEYGAGIGDYYISLPKGAIHDGEELFETADRELQEEAGYGARRFTFLKELYLSPSYMGNHISVVLAEDLYEQSLPGDEPEPLQVIPCKLAELDQLVAQQAVKEAYGIAALYLAKSYLAKRHFAEREQTPS